MFYHAFIFTSTPNIYCVYAKRMTTTDTPLIEGYMNIWVPFEDDDNTAACTSWRRGVDAQGRLHFPELAAAKTLVWTQNFSLSAIQL